MAKSPADTVSANPVQSSSSSINKRSSLPGNKALIYGAIGVLVVGAIVWGVMGQIKKTQMEEVANVVHDFRETTLNSFSEIPDPQAKPEEKKTPKISKESFMSELTGIWNLHGGSPVLGPVLVESMHALYAQQHVAEAIVVAEWGLEKYRSQADLYWFFGHALAGFYEDQQRIDDSIALLEKMTQSKIGILEQKLYFDLGRLYQQKGDMVKATTALEYVIANFPNEDEAKFAKALLGEMN